MSRNPDDVRMRNKSSGDWLSTLIVVGVYFAYMLVLSLSPAFFARPLRSGHLLSVGLAAGIVVAVLTILLAALYTYRRNGSERRVHEDSSER